MALADTLYTEADIIALKRAMSSGVLSVTGSDGKAVTYRSLKDMAATLAMMQREVYGTRGRKRVQIIEIREEGS